MADYFAVLQRTLSGFADPKAELRVKLYERARATIERQLQTRTPPIEGEALQAELQKLEQAIIDTERGFVHLEAAQAVPNVEETPAPPPPKPEPVPLQEPPIPTYSPPSTPVEQTIEPELVQETAAESLVESAPVPEPIPAPVQEPVSAPLPEPVDSPIPEMESVVETITEQPVAVDPIPVIPAASPVAPPSPTLEIPENPAPQQLPVSDPVEEWAKEFLSNEPEGSSTPPPVASQQIPEFTPAEAIAPQLVPQVEEAPQSAHAGEPTNVPQAAEALPTFSPVVGDDLSIPPAPGYTPRAPRKRKKRGFLRWILMILVLIGLSVAGFFGWQSRNHLIETFGLQSWFDDPTRPKPVKTISIKPDPIKPEANGQATKSETRLNPDASDSTQTQPAEVKRVVPPIAQNAVLYEVGGTAADNSVDAGRVVWTTVQEEPLAGLPKEPAIRARVEIPSRKVVLIMTIKRNGDKSVPASHLLEFVFAVPDNFSGGGIGSIQSPRFKEQEQTEGAELVGVPVDVTEGIFMVALNNLETAVKQNQSLMKDRNWIDIPMIYRTGRRASLSIEKGQPGKKVFDEVFAAWEKL